MRIIILAALLSLSNSPGGVLLADQRIEQEPVASRRQENEREPQDEDLEQEVAERMAQCLNLVIDAEQTVEKISPHAPRALGYVALGEALWEHEQERARGHLRRAFETVSQMPYDDSWRYNSEGSLPHPNPFEIFPVITRRIAKLDPTLAYELTRRFGQTMEDGSVVFRKEEGPFRRHWAMLYVAETLVENDPARAAAIATEVMERDAGLIYAGVLLGIRNVDRNQADRLAWETLKMIASHQPPKMSEFYSLGSYIFPRTRLPLAYANAEAEKFPINRELAASFLPAFLRAMQQSVRAGPWPGAPEFVSFGQWYTALLELRPYVQEYAPTIASQYEVFMTEVGRQVTESKKRALEKFQERMKDPSSESLDELLQKADSESNPARRDRVLAAAVYAAIKMTRFERVEEILRKIHDLSIRREMGELYHFRAAQYEAALGEVDRARRHTGALKKPELMVLAFLAIAESRQQAEAGLTQSLLAEADRRVAPLPDSAEKARATLRLAGAYELVDPTFARQLMATALIRMGKTAASLDDLAGVSIQLDTFREKGKLILERRESDLTTTLTNLMRKLSAEDFDWTLLTITQVAPGETRLMAELVLAQEGFRWIKQVSGESPDPDSAPDVTPPEPPASPPL